MSLIQQLVAQRENDLIADEKQKESEREAVLGAAKAQVEAALGDLHGDVGPYSDYGTYASGGAWQGAKHLPGSVQWQVNHPKYGTFWVAANVVYPTGPTSAKVTEVRFMNYPGGGSVKVDEPERVADFFLDRVKEIRANQDKVLNNRIDFLKTRLGHHPAHATPAQAEADLKELIELDPQREANYRLMFSVYQEKNDAWQQELTRRSEAEAAAKVEADAQRQKQAQAAQAYREALTAWWEAYEQVLQSNKAKLKEMQFHHDAPFRLWELSYSLSGRDEGGEEMFEERSFYVLSATPRDGMWDVWDTSAERVSRTAVFNAAWLKELGNVKPTGKHGVCVTIKPAGMSRADSLKVSPLWWNQKAAIQAEVDKEMLPFPPRPSADEFPNLTERDEYNITEEVLS